jgi:hypothetical protein
MKKDTVRVYVAVGGVIWEIYKIWIEKGSFYCTFSPHQKGFNTKTTYHPIEKQKWGLIHTKTNEPGTRSREQGRMTAAAAWPEFRELEIAPIYSYGFETNDFVNNWLFLEKMKTDSVKEPGLTFNISNITPAFCLRIFLCKTQLLGDRKFIEDKITSGGAEQLLEHKIHNFREFRVDDKNYELSCIVCLIGMEQL